MADLKYHWAIPVSDPSKHRNAWKAYVGRHYVQACGRAYRGSTYAESAAVYVSYVTKDPEWHCYDCARAARLVFPEYQRFPANCFYRADESNPRTKPLSGKWRPSLLMPRWACRLVLPLVSVRVERVQDITEEDARAEGLRRTENGWTDGTTGYDVTSARAAFQELWASIYGQASWDVNPWVWVAEWKEIEVSR